jgi:hypothetical protein
MKLKVWLAWLLDEYVNHRLPQRLFARWLCDLTDRLLMDMGRGRASNIPGHH